METAPETRQGIERLLKGDLHDLEAAQTTIDHLHTQLIAMDDRLHDPFFYEIWPLLFIARSLGQEDARLCFCSQFQERGHDGEIHLSNVRYDVEFVRAGDIQNEPLAMEFLELTGRAPAFVPIEASGNKKNRIFGKNELTFARYKTHAWYREIADELYAAYYKKQNQKYRGKWLGITFDDHRLHRRERHLFDIPCQMFWSSIAPSNEIFSRIFIVGISGEFLWDSAKCSQDSGSRCACP